MSGAEAGLVLGLISSAIAIFQEAHELYDAYKDASGLPKKFRTAAGQIPLILYTLNLAGHNIEADNVTEESARSAKPVMQQCKERADALKKIFVETIPADDDSKTTRLTKYARFRKNADKVKENMEEVAKGMELLAQHQIFSDTETLNDIKEAIDKLNSTSDEDESRFANYGSGPLNVHQGSGDLRSYTASGSGAMHNIEKQYIGRDQGTE